MEHLSSFCSFVLVTKEAVSVPLIVARPQDTDRGGVVTRFVSLVDLFPSLASLAGLGPVPACPRESSKVR